MTASGSQEVEEADRLVKADNLRLYVREQGDGHPLLMVNGLGGNLEMWGPAGDHLAKGSRLIMFDAPGTGRSEVSFAPRTVGALARLVWDLVDELGYESIDILGYSFGGVVAQQLAREEPTRVRRLALVGTSCGWGSMPGTLGALAVVAMPIRYYSRFLYERTNCLIGESLNGDGEQHVAGRLAYPPSIVGYMHQLCASTTFSSLPWLAGITTPTLVVTGELDRLVPAANSVQLASLLPNSRLHLLDGDSHLLLFDPRSTSLDLLRDFFTSPELEGSAAWGTGTEIDAETARVALEDSIGAQPWRTVSAGYRWLVQASPFGPYLG